MHVIIVSFKQILENILSL